MSDNTNGSLSRPKKIVSGGQTGVDRGALDATIALGIEHGGWCPRGRLAEDGKIPSHYHLSETTSRNYSVRTERNILDSDATLILHRGPLRGGTELTRRLAQQHSRALLVVDLALPPPPDTIRSWLAKVPVEVLNIAGPRESQCSGIQLETTAFIERLFARSARPLG